MNKQTPFVVGLTGGIGSGKSAATDIFASLGIDIVDADEVARDVVAVGSQGLLQIAEHFGERILLEDGSLDRAALREKVFANPDEKTWLNNYSTAYSFSHATANHGIDFPYCILSVPLLVENKLTEMCNHVVVVDCLKCFSLNAP